MSSIVVGMKADQIAVQNTQKQSLSNWEDSVYLAAREWGMQEEANLDILLRCSNLLS